jgi:hypothetical protein
MFGIQLERSTKGKPRQLQMESHELQLDPAEWMWQRQGNMQIENFFNYTTKRGYQISTKK